MTDSPVPYFLLKNLQQIHLHIHGVHWSLCSLQVLHWSYDRNSIYPGINIYLYLSGLLIEYSFHWKIIVISFSVFYFFWWKNNCKASFHHDLDLPVKFFGIVFLGQDHICCSLKLKLNFKPYILNRFCKCVRQASEEHAVRKVSI